ncbi:MAG: hypothetical protein JJE48_03995, partial [Actinobacteria bacterium]|nr:hypothetical protein [Actinomycetota bacterium]
DWDSGRSNGNPFEVGPSDPQEATGWLFAEGATWPGFDEWVLVQNPNGEPSAVSVTFFTPGGRVNGPNFSVPGQSRYSVHVNEFVPDQDVATSVSVTNGVPVCAERAMYVSTSDGKWGSHDSAASPAAAGVWYLAEGATWPGFDEWVLVMNPNSSPVSVRLTFQTPGGNVSGPSLNLAGFTRGTVHVNDYIPHADVSTTVTCTTPGKGVVAERSMYINTPDGRRGCHNSMGLNEANSGWGLAEGATWEGFEEWVLVQNPTDVPANVRFYFLTPYGYGYGPEGTVYPGTRLSVRVNDYIPYSDVSTMIFTESEDEKVVVERAMYINTPDGKRGAHNAPGSEYASTSWYLPEGCTLPGFDEWVLVVNPDTEENAFVQLTFMTPGGPVKGPSGILPPATRATCHVNDFVRGSVSTKVESEGYVVCERAMYINTYDGKGGATDSLGVLASSLGQTAGSSVAGRGTKDEPVLRLRPRYLQK